MIDKPKNMNHVFTYGWKSLAAGTVAVLSSIDYVVRKKMKLGATITVKV